jgi:hypothetical protein
VLFSREALYGVFESYNADIWPVQIIWLVLAATLIALLRRGDVARGRIVFSILAAACLWVGLVFHLQYFLPINWAATYFAGLFVVEAVLLLGLGVFTGTLQLGKHTGVGAAVGMALLATSAFVPLEMVGGAALRQTALFGWGPDHTALGTIGIMLIAKGRARLLLLGPPVLWCVIAVLMYNGAR